MKVHIVKPYDIDKNLGRAYNEAMSRIPEGDWACLMDLDTLFLTPDAGTILHKYAIAYPETGIFTCRTNRIHPLQKCQLYLDEPSDIVDIRYWINEAKKLSCFKQLSYSGISNVISGFIMMVSKATWNEIKFNESGKCLGVDTDFSQRVLASGRDIKCMEVLLVWHTYRLRNITDKTHLL